MGVTAPPTNMGGEAAAVGDGAVARTGGAKGRGGGGHNGRCARREGAPRALREVGRARMSRATPFLEVSWNCWVEWVIKAAIAES